MLNSKSKTSINNLLFITMTIFKAQRLFAAAKLTWIKRLELPDVTRHIFWFNFSYISIYDVGNLPLKCMNLKKTKAMFSFSFVRKQCPSQLRWNPYQEQWEDKEIQISACCHPIPPGHPAMVWRHFNPFQRCFCLALSFGLAIRSIQWFHFCWLGNTFRNKNDTIRK